MSKWYFLKFSFNVNSFLLHSIYGLKVIFTINEIKFELSLISEISESAHHGCDLLYLLIKVTMMSGSFVDGLIKLELPKSVLLDFVIKAELMTDGNGKVTVIFDDFGKITCESIIWLDLLTYKPSLFKVTVKHFPHVLLSDCWTDILVRFHYL